MLMIIGLSVLACTGPIANTKSASQPDRRYEAGYFALHVDDMAIRLNSIDDPEAFFVITNISWHRVDYFRSVVIPLDREGQPVANPYGEVEQYFGAEEDLAPGSSGRYMANFGLWEKPIKSVRITLISVTLENGKVEECNPETQKCSWEVSRD